MGSIYFLVFVGVLMKIVIASDDAAGKSIYRNCLNRIYDTSVRSGRITSPGFPNYFKRNLCRLWSINLKPGYNITITFNKLQIPSTVEGVVCHGSHLDIGPEPIMHVCGEANRGKVQPYTSNHDLVWIRFITSNTSATGEGFDLEFVTGPVPTSSCPSDQFLCHSQKCILNIWVCNGISECGDGSDERGCSVPTPVPTVSCPRGHFQCRNQQCIPKVLVCNGMVECADGSDEIGCRHKGCAKGQFKCISANRWEDECFTDFNRCDGKVDCKDGSDETNCTLQPSCGSVYDRLMGDIVPKFDKYQISECNWTIHVRPGHVVQIRFPEFRLNPGPIDGVSYSGETLTLYDGRNAEGTFIGQYSYYHRPPTKIESHTNWVFVQFYGGARVSRSAKFNMTFQQKGSCFPYQKKCAGERDCYNNVGEKTERCDGVWDCRRHGADEQGCGKCDAKTFLCGEKDRCYTEAEHCNGKEDCLNYQDERMCTSGVCNSENGTFLCRNLRCVYESYLCDGRDDCGDSSDEANCGVPSVRIILAAVVGSLVCALLLVIAIGCIIRLFSVRFHEHHGGTRYETPMSRLQAEFMQRQAPPNYAEAMRTSRPFSEFIAQIRAAGQSIRGNRSRSGSDVSLLVPCIGDDENTSGRTVTDNAADSTQETRRPSNASDVTVSSSDSSLIQIHSSDPSQSAYEQELNEEMSPNATSCIDISSSNETIVQWTRMEQNNSQTDLSADADDGDSSARLQNSTCDLLKPPADVPSIQPDDAEAWTPIVCSGQKPIDTLDNVIDGVDTEGPSKSEPPVVADIESNTCLHVPTDSERDVEFKGTLGSSEEVQRLQDL